MTLRNDSTDLDAATLNRRQFLNLATMGGGLAGSLGSSRGEWAVPGVKRLVDVNVSLGVWPFRRLPNDEPRALSRMLRTRGVEEAWVGSFDGLLHKDLAAVNARLADECKRQKRGFFVPFGCVNPAAPDWEEDLRRCIEEHRMPGIRLHPNYHEYALDHPDFSRLLGLASRHRLIVQLALIMEDERMVHPRLKLNAIDLKPFARALKSIDVPVVLLNAFRTVNLNAARELAQAGPVYFEMASLEGVAGIERLLEQIPLERVLFGSHSPFFYFESALLKLRESVLSTEELRAISSGNARRLRRSIG